MATEIHLQHPDTGLIKTGLYGFSWTTLFFGAFPALFRHDFKTFFCFLVVYTLLGLPSFGVGCLLVNFIWAFMYNGYYTRKLLQEGYVFTGSADQVAEAAAALKVAARTGAQ